MMACYIPARRREQPQTYCTQAEHSTTCVNSNGTVQTKYAGRHPGPDCKRLNRSGQPCKGRERGSRAAPVAAVPFNGLLFRQPQASVNFPHWCPHHRYSVQSQKGTGQIAGHFHSLPPHRICGQRAWSTGPVGGIFAPTPVSGVRMKTLKHVADLEAR